MATATPAARNDDLITAASAILDRNWTGAYTVPATGLYPHQWSWDSGFIAMGLRHVRPLRAQQELESLLSAQWLDGRLPQIVYDDKRDDDYSPGATFWRSSEISGTPQRPTAGLIQPPNHAWAAWEVHRADTDVSDKSGFLQRAYPRLAAWHEYLRVRRTSPDGRLAHIVHPWESGMDNSPLWDVALSRVPSSVGHEIRRPDLKHAEPGERPNEKDYGRYFWLAEHYRDRGCSDRAGDGPFQMEDPTFNALWAKSELALGQIAERIGADPTPHRHRAGELTDALADLHHPGLGIFTARDVATGTLVAEATVSGVVPLIIPGLPESDRVLDTLLGPRFLGAGPLMVPSYDVTAAGHDPARYWRGPAWFNMTWLVHRALEEHREWVEAQRLARNVQELALKHRFPEYVDPGTGEPHGSTEFSWTAALAIDLAEPSSLGVV